MKPLCPALPLLLAASGAWAQTPASELPAIPAPQDPTYAAVMVRHYQALGSSRPEPTAQRKTAAAPATPPGHRSASKHSSKPSGKQAS